MAASLEGARDRWDRMNHREQRLVVLLAVAILVCIAAAMVAGVQGSMRDLETGNAEARKALRALAVYRDAKERAKSTGTAVHIPEKAVELDSYLEKIISKLSLKSPTYPALKTNKLGIYEELSFEVTLKAMTIESLTSLLEEVESGSKLVVVKELNVDKNFRDKEKLDLTFTVATYRKMPAKKDRDATSSGDGKASDGEEG